MSRPLRNPLIIAVLFVITIFIGGCGPKEGETPIGFSVIEATIADIHEAYRSGDLTCRELVDVYLERIDKYDKSTRLNAIVLTNKDALKTADELDAEFQKTGQLRPLHGIPVIVKDNYETYDMQTTGGSMALMGFIPPDDAYQVRKLREAGAIMLAKSNMAEWAFSPYHTLSSTAGVTANPYDLNRVPAGSSGGTAAAVAANFGTVGLGTDTGNSIRGPSSHCSLVGIRSTMGLTSRDGIIPLYLRNDIGGPMCRTLEDAVRVLEVIAGYDPDDPITERSKGKIPENYTQYLDKDGLKGARIGVFRLYTDMPTTDSEVLVLFEQAIKDIKSAGAEVVDPFVIPDFGRLTKGIWCDMFRHDINNYLASVGDAAPIKNLLEVYNKGLFATPNKMRIFHALEVPLQEEPACKDLYTEPKNVAFREAVFRVMADQNVDFIIYPTWSNPPRKLADFKSPAGDNSQLIPPHTGMPGVSIPMGYTYENLPAGLQIVGRNFDEPNLIRVVYAYEQATLHRRSPKRFD
ncbi:MAG: amidase family protein [Candidatus Aminicenantes bacterium]|jgi:Asp-tRNA(Asn)/Glu-tRNA(Gln) amidotransferase A subunit family amidase